MSENKIKKRSDLFREYARVMDMTSGTNISPNECVKTKTGGFLGQPANRFYDAMKNFVAEVEKGFVIKNYSIKFSSYKIVQNKGDLALACKLKQNTSRPWIYERRRETIKCDWMIK